MSSDRTQLKQAMAGSIGDSRTIATAPLAAGGCVAQDAQRFEALMFQAAVANNVNQTISVCRVDRPVMVKEVRILPGGALTQDTGNLTLSYGYTNDNGGSLTVQGSINTNTSANGGTGNWAAQVSIVVTANTLVNATVPSGSNFCFKVANAGAGLAVPAYTALQVLWEEV